MFAFCIIATAVVIGITIAAIRHVADDKMALYLVQLDTEDDNADVNAAFARAVDALAMHQSIATGGTSLVVHHKINRADCLRSDVRSAIINRDIKVRVYQIGPELSLEDCDGRLCDWIKARKYEER